MHNLIESQCERHDSLHSMVVRLPSITTLGDRYRSVMDVLLCSRFNSSQGIKLLLDKPINMHTLLNIDRPAVLRQHFGMKVYKLSNVLPGIEYGYTYGSGTGISSVGMDRSKFFTRPFTPSLNIIARELHLLINSDVQFFDAESVNTNIKFNHCSILIYYAGSELKTESTLGMHYSCVYSVNDGSFTKNANSQVENTPAVIYSLGDSRILKWRKRNTE